MTILDALNDTARLSNGKKWLFIDDGIFKVYDHPYRAKNSIWLLQTDNEEEAVEELMR